MLHDSITLCSALIKFAFVHSFSQLLVPHDHPLASNLAIGSVGL